MRVKTQSGKSISLTDLFFYNTHVDGVENAGYWTKPENWDQELTFTAIGRENDAHEGVTILIQGKRGPLTKQVYVSMYPDDSAVYVVNRLSTSQSTKIQDRHTSHFSSDPKNPAYPAGIFVDGVDASHPQGVLKQMKAERYVYAYIPRQDLCMAILMASSGLQQLKLKNPLEYHGLSNGREFHIAGINGQKLDPGHAVELRYVIYWNDGDKSQYIKQLSKRLQEGKYKKRFYPQAKTSETNKTDHVKLAPKQVAATDKKKIMNPREYLSQVQSTKWTDARSLTIHNQSPVNDTLAVTVHVESVPDITYAITTPGGQPMVSQADDLDGDGCVDEVCFLIPLKAGEKQEVILLSKSGQAVTAMVGLRKGVIQAGSYKPIRIQPTSSPAVTQHSTHISPINLSRAREQMQSLEQTMPMEVVECNGMRLLLGQKSGLIEAMRPYSIPEDYVGSYLREYVPGHDHAGTMKILADGPIRTVYKWLGNGRMVRVYDNGVIDSTWENSHRHMQIITCAYPYAYVQTHRQGIVRYSQMIERRRSLSQVDSLSFWGRNDASIQVNANGLLADDHQVWLDSGELGWNVGVDFAEKQSREDPYQRVGRLCADTFIAGGLHVTSWNSKGEDARLVYRVANFGKQSLNAANGLIQINAVNLVHASLPALRLPMPTSAIQLKFDKTNMTVNRLYPNEFNGWQLQPKRLATHNPQPAYFAGTFENTTDKPVTVHLQLDKVNWIMAASLLLDPKQLQNDKTGQLTQWYEHEQSLLIEDKPIAIVLPAGESIPLEVCLRPVEGTLGRLGCKLRWETSTDTGCIELSVMVRPTNVFAPVYAPASELGAEYATMTCRGTPIIYDLMYFGGTTSERDNWYYAFYRDYERHGFWASDPIKLKSYYTGHDAGAFSNLSPTQWANAVVDRMNDPRFADYRIHVYLHDEIFEHIGGYKGRWRPLREVANLDAMITMNVKNAAWPSFMEQAIKKDTQYQVKLPSDIAEVFYYCGQDQRLHDYAKKLIGPRNELFAKWTQDSSLTIGTDPEKLRQLYSFWISTQLHVTRYESVRRQCWWLRHQGFDLLRSWAFRGDYRLYSGRIMHWMTMPVDINEKRKHLLTDRGLAWMDMKRDMELVTLVNLLKDEERDTEKRVIVKKLTQHALDASQSDDFDQARHLYVKALALLRPDLLYLAPSDHWNGTVDAVKLKNLLDEDDHFIKAQQIPSATIPLTDQNSTRPSPTIDGQLDNAYLEQGATLELQSSNGGKVLAPTTAYLARDHDNLYVFFICNEPQIKAVRAQATERDSAVYDDDCVEVFIDHKGDGKQYAHIAVNVRGVIYDALQNVGAKWDIPMSVVSRQDDNSWCVEIKIPFQSFGHTPRFGDAWRVNFNRERKVVRELSAWSATFGSFHQPKRFGKIEFD